MTTAITITPGSRWRLRPRPDDYDNERLGVLVIDVITEPNEHEPTVVYTFPSHTHRRRPYPTVWASVSAFLEDYEPIDPEPKPDPPTSVGQLMDMSDSEREQRIASLSAETRCRLGHLAAIGAQKSLVRSLAYNNLIRELTEDA